MLICAHTYMCIYMLICICFNMHKKTNGKIHKHLQSEYGDTAVKAVSLYIFILLVKLFYLFFKISSTLVYLQSAL